MRAKAAVDATEGTRWRIGVFAVAALLATAASACFGEDETGPTLDEAAEVIRKDAARFLTIIPLIGGDPKVTANADVDIECEDGGVRREYRAVAPVVDPQTYEDTHNLAGGRLLSLGYDVPGSRPEGRDMVARRKESIRTHVVVRIDHREEISFEATTDCW